jgi:hypothetical protein
MQRPGDRLDAHGAPPGRRATPRLGLASGLSFGLIHPRPGPFTSGHGLRVRPGQEHSWPVMNGGAQSSKACEGATPPWVQIPPPPPLTWDDLKPVVVARLADSPLVSATWVAPVTPSSVPEIRRPRTRRGPQTSSRPAPARLASGASDRYIASNAAGAADEVVDKPRTESCDSLYPTTAAVTMPAARGWGPASGTWLTGSRPSAAG